ncbi:MAG TPA: methyl-accepting chemotaxis protein [Xanthobacteraceae bacterium]|nr:methyl-accepting chemotaxis protein [Xanthobacteraceae bacterium]
MELPNPFNAGPARGKDMIGFSRSLAWRLALPVPLILIIAIALTWLIVPRIVESMATNDAYLANQQVASEFKTIRTYYTENVVSKVLKGSSLKASYDHKTNEGAIPLPATLLHDLSGLLADKDTRIQLFSQYPFPDRKDRKLDDFQREAWAYLNANPAATFSRLEVIDGKHVARVAIADKMSSEACVNCHNSDPRSPKTDWKVGDVRGVLEVSSVIDQQLAHGATLSNLMVGGAGVVGLALLAITFWLTRGITRPMSGMVRAMRQLAAGNFDVMLPGRGRRDELGAMAEAVELFKAKALERARREAEEKEAKKEANAAERRAEMQRLASGFETAVGSIVTAVSQSARELEAAAGTLTNNAETTRHLSSVVTTASSEASDNVRSVAEAAHELASSVAEIRHRASESSRIANDAVLQAGKTDARITELSAAATRIGNVVNLIMDIAQQTNLLALNATIEAARAGDAGRGFSVVASEVKTLATQTAKATDEIATQIAEMQGATQESVNSIKEIVSTIARISETAAAISAAVEAQSASAHDIGRNVENAANSAVQVAANIANVNRAASETGTASDSVLTSAKTLSTEGSKFRLAVEKFLATVRAA